MSYTSLKYHIVFSTRYREPVLEPAWRKRLYDYFGGCFRTAGGVLTEMNGAFDHVHALAGLRATHCLADVLRDVKRATSSWIHQTIGISFHWQEGYGAFTVSPHDCAGLIRYIRDQEEHHRVRTFREEYEALLREHGIEFDERYLL
jgi:putative transposase